MFSRAVALLICLISLGCEHDRTSKDVHEVYASAMADLAPAVNHFNVAADKVEFGADNLGPNMQQVGEHGIFEFPDSSGLLTSDDFASLSVTLLYERDFDEITSDDCEIFWKNFRAKYGASSGFFRVSEVGFNDTGDKAIFYLEGRGGCLAGRGALVVMGREGDRWVVVQNRELWVG